MTHNPSDPFDSRTAHEPISETINFGVEGEDPAGHADQIKQLLEDFPGLTQVAPHADAERVEVTYDARLTNPAAIHTALLAKGYHAARWTQE